MAIECRVSCAARCGAGRANLYARRVNKGKESVAKAAETRDPRAGSAADVILLEMLSTSARSAKQPQAQQRPKNNARVELSPKELF